MEFEKLAEIIGDVLNLDPGSIRREDRLDKLGADSLDVFQIVIGIEEELGKEVDPAVAEKLRTVGDVFDAIAKMT